MASLTKYWIMGLVVCDSCGHEWEAAVDAMDLARYWRAVVAIVTGSTGFCCACPRCGRAGCRMTEISGI